MSIGSHSNRPPAYIPIIPLLTSAWVGPHSLMIVEVIGEVVLNEVLPRCTQIHRVPVIELMAEFPSMR